MERSFDSTAITKNRGVWRRPDHILEHGPHLRLESFWKLLLSDMTCYYEPLHSLTDVTEPDWGLLSDSTEPFVHWLVDPWL